MTVVTDTSDSSAPGAAQPEAKSKKHPSDRDYVVLALILGLLTAAEIAVYFVEDDLSSVVVYTSLIGMMIVKFIMVGGWFMHLKHDNPVFMRLFIFGLILALIVFGGALTSLEMWFGNWSG